MEIKTFIGRKVVKVRLKTYEAWREGFLLGKFKARDDAEAYKLARRR